MASAVTALVDLSVIRDAVTVEPAVQDQTLVWGQEPIHVQIGGYRRKAWHLHDDYKREQVNALPTIATLARDGTLALHTYSELMFEEFWGAQGMRGSVDDMLAGVRFRSVPAAVERSRFQQSDVLEHAQREPFNNFYDLLRDLSDDLLSAIDPYLTGFERQNVADIGRFRDLSRHVPRKHYADMFHLWTAETNRIPYFLTMDHKFVNFMFETSQCEVKAEPVTPTELLDRLGNVERVPMPVANDDGFYQDLE